MRLSRTYVLRASLLSLASSMLLVAGCQDLPIIAAGVCGNGVVERDHNEDCDCLVVSDDDEEIVFDPNETLSSDRCNSERPAGKERCAFQAEAHACRFVCTGDAKCPSGYSCGSDEVCRRPNGAFEVLGSAIAVEAERMEIADFDGDGRDDLLAIGTSTVSAAFTEPDGALSSVVSLATNGATPASGKLTGLIRDGTTDDATTGYDETDDLVLAIGYGTNVFQGGGGRTFSPTTYGTSEIMGALENIVGSKSNVDLLATIASVSVPAMTPGKTVPAFAVAMVEGAGGGAKTGRIVRAVLGSAADPGFVSAATPAVQISAPPELPLPIADTSGDALPEVVIAPSGSNEVIVFSPFAVGSAFSQPTIIKLRTDPNGKTFVAGRAFLYDIDTDNKLDVLVTTSCPLAGDKPGPIDFLDCFELQVAKNLGNGLFETTATRGMQLTPTGVQMGGKDDPPHFYRPLAIGDLNEDSHCDILDALGVRLSPNDPQNQPYVRAYRNARAPFVSGAVFDANHDDHLDVFGGSDLSPEITFLAGMGTDVFGESLLATRGPVDHFTPGDFDGDGVKDLAFSEWNGPIEGVGEHMLSVSFGRGLGYPEQPTRMASFGRLSSMSNVNFGFSGIDAANDLQVTFSESVSGSALTIGAIVGTSTRQLQCAHVEIESSMEVDSSVSIQFPRKYFVGDFVEDAPDAKHLDVAFVGSAEAGSTSVFTVLSSSGVAELERAASVEGIGELPLTAESAQFVDGVVLNLDGGLDEILIAAGNQAQGELALITFGATGPTLTDANRMNAAGTLFYKHFRVVDMDGKNGDDVIALGYSLEPKQPQGMGKGLGLKSWATVMLNDGNGHLCWAPKADAGCVVIAKDLDEPILDLDWLDVEGDGQKEIIAITQTRVQVLDLVTDDAGTRLEARQTDLPLSIQEGWSAIRRCDANADGVADLALASSGQLYIFGGVPELR